MNSTNEISWIEFDAVLDAYVAHYLRCPDCDLDRYIAALRRKQYDGAGNLIVDCLKVKKV